MNGATPNIEAALKQAAGYVQATWQQTVMGSMGVPGAKPIRQNINLRRLYADNIVTSDMLVGMGNLGIKVLATKKIAEEMEYGKGKWDMKPMLLGGPKARMGKNGKYNIIPFRHGMSAKHSPDNNFKTMPTAIYKQARELKASVKQGNGVKYGGRMPATSMPASNPSTGYRHKSDIYKGMVRIEKTYRAATQNKYMTFRVVSEHSDPASWWHPGYEAHNIARSVANFCRPAVEDMIRQAVELDLQNAIVRIG